MESDLFGSESGSCPDLCLDSSENHLRLIRGSLLCQLSRVMFEMDRWVCVLWFFGCHCSVWDESVPVLWRGHERRSVGKINQRVGDKTMNLQTEPCMIQ